VVTFVFLILYEQNKSHFKRFEYVLQKKLNRFEICIQINFQLIMYEVLELKMYLLCPQIV